MLSLDEAREWMRIDDTDNDRIIQGLLDAVPGYIETTTGMDTTAQLNEPLVDTVTKFLLLLWYDVQSNEAARLQRIIDNMLKTITVKAREQQTS